MKITVHYWPKRDRWVVSYPGDDGKRKCALWATKDEAMADATRRRTNSTDDAKSFLLLPDSDREKLVAAYRLAQERGLDLFAALQSKPEPQPGDGPPLDEVIAELLEVKQKAGKSKPYRNNLRLLLNQFASGREKMRVGVIGLVDVEKWLDGYTLASRSTLRARLSTLFKFAMRRGYRVDNPCARLESVSYIKPPPAILTVEQTETCWKELLAIRKSKARNSPRFSYRHALPWFALTTFCGLRPEEAEKTRRSDIHLKEGWVRVEAQTSKKGQRRIVYPHPAALSALKSALKVGRLPLGHRAKQRTIKFLRGALGFGLKAWPKDVTRHTAASYWLAVTRKAGDIAESLGNSEKVLKRDYQALVTQKQGEEFWELVRTLRTT